MSEARDALEDAQLLVATFVELHRAAAIPALIGACVGWAIENGGGDLVRNSLTNAIAMSHGAEAAWKRAQQ